MQELERHKDYYDDCVFNSKYTLRQRLSKYPFNKAMKIVAVSHPLPFIPNAEIIYTTDSPEVVAEKKRKAQDTTSVGLNINNGILNANDIIESITLTKSQTTELTRVIFNTGYKVKDKIQSYREGACFNPRNALLFYDKNGKIFDYIEICFECQKNYSESGRIKIGTLCNQKYDLLRKWFISIGMKYGTLKG